MPGLDVQVELGAGFEERFQLASAFAVSDGYAAAIAVPGPVRAPYTVVHAEILLAILHDPDPAGFGKEGP